MKLLFINSNLQGHINPTLGLVKELTDKGNRVSYFCSELFSEQITKMGAKWIGFSNKLNFFLKEYRPTDRHPFFMLMEYILSYDEVVLPEILNILKENQYDMIICDSIFGGACFLKQITKIPVVCSHSSFAMSKAPVPKHMLVAGFHPQLDHCYQILKRMCENYKIQEPSLEQIFTSKGDLNIVYTTRTFNGDDNVQEPDYLFAGPSVDREEVHDLDLSMIKGRKLIYISLGSLNTDFVDFYKTCISAFRDTDSYVCMSIGQKCEASQIDDDIPLNFLVKSFLPQLELLKRADVFITHAGFNSVNEALYFGVPMLALPQVNDQHMVAKRLSTMQLGITENIKELSPEILKAKTETLIMDSHIKENCMSISQEMRNSAKLEHVVLELEKYADAWKVRE